MARASSMLPASGFSQATCLPASRAAMAISAWALLGLVTSTRLMSGLVMALCQLVSELRQPQRFLKASSSSVFRPTTVCITGLVGRLKNLSTLRKALLWARPMNLSPIKQIFATSLGMVWSPLIFRGVYRVWDVMQRGGSHSAFLGGTGLSGEQDSFRHRPR